MAQYEIKFNRLDGWSYNEASIPVEKVCVELSDEEVQTLIDLMNECGTYDVSELGLEESHPDLFNKLDEACDSLAWNTAVREALAEAHYYDELDAYCERLCNYCEINCDYDESLGDFNRWFDDYISSMTCNALRNLYSDANIDIWDEVLSYEGIEKPEYDVLIPQSIVKEVFDI